MTRRRLLPALAAGATLTGALAPRQSRAQATGRLVEAPPRPLPDLSFIDPAGAERRPGEFPGRGLVLNLWATWCPPCVAELPSLDRLAALVEAEGILVLPLSSDRGGAAQVQAFYERLRIRHLGVWLDPRGAAMRALGARGLPTTIIVDRRGRETARLEGDTVWDSPAMLAALRRLTRAEVAPELPSQT